MEKLKRINLRVLREPDGGQDSEDPNGHTRQSDKHPGNADPEILLGELIADFLELLAVLSMAQFLLLVALRFDGFMTGEEVAGSDLEGPKVSDSRFYMFHTCLQLRNPLSRVCHLFPQGP